MPAADGAALTEGRQIGPYRVLAGVGAGGMGEVYRARDTRLDRDVAIKILPAHLAAEPGRLDRFKREARAISSLNHPSICTLYDVGEFADVSFLVMELLDGETLETRLRRGPLPVETVRKYAVQIADALRSAHEKGVVHRDLKPGNVMVTKSRAKVLDFGLAKVAETRVGALTETNVVMGTPGYMAPEQLAGGTCDARTDVYALGLLMAEMLTGTKPRGGTPLPDTVPRELARIVARCLADDPAERWQSAGDLAAVLEWAEEQPAARAGGRAGWYAVGAVATALVVAAVTALLSSSAFAPAAPQEAIRFSFGTPTGTALAGSTSLTDSFPEPSPDGRRIAFVVRNADATTALWVRSLGGDSEAVPGTEGAEYPFWSPDGESLGFFANGKLMRVALAGGPPQVLADAPAFASGTWAPSGDIVFSPSNRSPLLRVRSGGGAPEAVTTLDRDRNENSHRFPRFLPDGRRFLFTARSSEATGVYVGSLDSLEVKRVLTAPSNAVYVAPGYLLFGRDGTLLAQPFDLDALEATGDTVPLAKVEQAPQSALSMFSASTNGAVVAYLPENAQRTELRWYDRAGTQLSVVGAPGRYASPRLSPDASKATLEISDPDTGNRDLWIVDLTNGLRSRWTSNAANDWYARWSPDGASIAFASDRTPRSSLYVKAVEGGETEQLLLAPSVGHAFPLGWSPDRQELAYLLTSEGTPRTGDLHLLALSADRQTRPLLTTPFFEEEAQFSPDGQWLLYKSDKSGVVEVYLRSLDGSVDRRISTDGGGGLAWRGDGQELFFLGPGASLMAVRVALGDSLQTSVPQPLFEACTSIFNSYAAHPSGERFLFLCPRQSEQQRIDVLVNWQSLLR